MAGVEPVILMSVIVEEPYGDRDGGSIGKALDQLADDRGGVARGGPVLTGHRPSRIGAWDKPQLPRGGRGTASRRLALDRGVR